MKCFMLPAQEDQANFCEGREPENILFREFENEKVYAAYLNGVDAIEDEEDEIIELNVIGSKVVYQRESGLDDDADVEEVFFGTPAEAEAFRLGIDDAEGFRNPIVYGEDEPEFARLREIHERKFAPTLQP